MIFHDRNRVLTLLALSLVLFLVVSPHWALAKKGQATSRNQAAANAKRHQTARISQPAEASRGERGPLYCDARAAFLLDALTGQVLYEQNADLRIPPASFVKVMTLYLVYDALRAGTLKLSDTVTISEKAWRIQGSKMFIKVGDRVKVEDLMKGIAIQSGNDACIAIAEHLAGSEDVFVVKMNEKAELIGMTNSQFRNAHGMPAEGQFVTARDMALLARHYIEDHPEALALHAQTEFEYNGIRQMNRNLLLYKNIGVDGLKTGHIEESGYHLVATAKREGQRMIAVVMGCERPNTRAVEAQKLLEYGFRNFATVEAVKKGAAFGPLRVKRGKVKEVGLIAKEDVRITVPRGKEKSVSIVPRLPEFATAPIYKGDALAQLAVQNEGHVVREIGLLAASDVEKSLLPPLPILLGAGGGLILIALVGLLMLRRRQKR